MLPLDRTWGPAGKQPARGRGREPLQENQNPKGKRDAEEENVVDENVSQGLGTSLSWATGM